MRQLDISSVLRALDALPSDPDSRRRLLASVFRLLGKQLGRDGRQNNPRASAASTLSPRQQQTLTYLLNGDSEKQIAAKLSLSPHTVHVYVKGVYRHFGASSRGELLAQWVDTG